jgi:large subunit ribosomal protein L1
MAKHGKKYNDVVKLIEPGVEYTLADASELVKKTSVTKFDSSVDVDIRLGVDPRHADQMVRGTVSLPHGIGKSVRVLALVNPAKQQEARDAGADHVGLDDYLEKIEGGWTDVDVIIATPDVMGKLGKLGRVLGPRGLMPNPKSGTVTMEVANAINEVKAGKIDFRVDKYGILHSSVGKVSFDADKIKENAEAFIQTVIKLKPSSAKGTYIKSVFLSSTMGPSIPVTRVGLQ